ncbi:1-(5-phosphoribosyl)-5-amino-4-imidazole-carboxylate (AIR) carboxylase [Desulfotomaculum nigrificans CO-1-SRB]|uniref:1-(5-phosphoribosyl)-5-amino-4-imidazole-carboxylate (AIR) carboxylase n=1 Tax=Desulfotomaculum nigrificans (strain DSM 14880 / VKM B-2319 / CO-1-SRB) TaxID=868595 RepID=F6B8T5_DESCC|nr:nickel pincer cofactor biosynthesis protein LarB [Desulfotomaculum nigrificans]AEF94778.1 1-(5-phosphoribosyl)-5-amino-4-imidazole-carboxylate (AIR) carboxylase [Desulfotomaculum nigrificans CO-1-SRB]
MDQSEIKNLLEQVRDGHLTIDQGLEKLKHLPYEDLGFVKIDHHRQLRRGFAEVVYCAGKTVEQVQKIMEALAKTEKNILGTRATPEMYEAVQDVVPDAEYHQLARLITVQRGEQKQVGNILVACAGTSDLPVAEEAAITAEIMGAKVDRLYDAGVAGIHRLLMNRGKLDAAKVVVVVAGMEGALASVVGGLVDKPVIAVPTSVGYGASFNGLAALLAMLNSCSAGVTVVNIDNGFGAGYAAAMINRMGE